MVGVYHDVAAIQPVRLPAWGLLAIELTAHDKLALVQHRAKVSDRLCDMLNRNLMHRITLGARHVHCDEKLHDLLFLVMSLKETYSIGQI